MMPDPTTVATRSPCSQRFSRKPPGERRGHDAGVFGGWRRRDGRCPEARAAAPSCRGCRIGRLTKTDMRLLRYPNAVTKARCFSTSVPSTAAGSSTPQCAVIGCPGQIGTDLARRAVADGEHEIHDRRVRHARTRPSSFDRCRPSDAVGASTLSAMGLTFPFG